MILKKRNKRSEDSMSVIQDTIIRELYKSKLNDNEVTGIYLGHKNYCELKHSCKADYMCDLIERDKFYGIPIYRVMEEDHFCIARQ